MSNTHDDIEDIKYTGYGSGSFAGPAFGGQTSQLDCPTAPKYSGDSITLRATPRDGIGPYSVVFKMGADPIPFDRLTSPLGITSNPTIGKIIIEDTTVGGTYILTNDTTAGTAGTNTRAGGGHSEFGQSISGANGDSGKIIISWFRHICVPIKRNKI